MSALRSFLSALCAGGLLLGATGCGQDIALAQSDPLYRGAEVFNQRCAGCHSLDAAASVGSLPERWNGGERTNGPNFNQRVESRADVLYAIRNGGFSGAIMPANIVVGRDAEVLADFVAKYAGKPNGR